ncbi:MAG: tRNA dihydrouridine(20/20a) synthase DusA [Deltaproteobacteria bacterium]|nr:tRNA dihydrouridine(20/20a) synthase DusA [Deltaproteobacteria bacterium]MBW2256647.1 tRNA dihydrouridine(20/20a) synthase DusA [Deltaproteobacteria bacterium]
MMERTNRHFRWFMRRLTQHTLLYTEMITAAAILHGDRDRLLAYDPDEHPLALQLGGDDPTSLARCAQIAEDLGYDEVNLNVGCPSGKVQRGRFGASLMLRPRLVAEAVAKMRAAVSIPVTVKHRIGVDDRDRYSDLLRFVQVVAEAGCDRFIVHARKAWLHGLSPKENRTLPPLRYQDVHRLKAELPHLRIEINGGLRCIGDYREQLRLVDSVMVGRAAWDNPYHFVEVDPAFYDAPAPVRARREVVEAMVGYLDRAVAEGTRPNRVARPLLNLFAGVPGARAWKDALSKAFAGGRGNGASLLEALARADEVRFRTEQLRHP